MFAWTRLRVLLAIIVGDLNSHIVSQVSNFEHSANRKNLVREYLPTVSRRVSGARGGQTINTFLFQRTTYVLSQSLCED